MSEPVRPGAKPADPAAERRAFGPAFGYLVAAVLVVAGAVAYGVSSLDEPVRVASNAPAPSTWALRDVPTPEPVAEATGAASSPVAAAVSRPESRMRDPNGDQTPDLRDYLNAGENPTLGEVINRLHQAGVHTGIGAFNPPNTRPKLIGLAVPEDFALPEGYVRHYQTTDDGQDIEPILMYAPDRQFVDAAGRPMAIPQDRVVPPEQAPPGLQLRRIVIPAPATPDKSVN